MAEVKALLEERGGRYGPFGLNGDVSQALKNVVRALPTWERLNAAQQEALDLIFTKVSRIMSGDPLYKDNWDDMAGYSMLGSQSCDSVRREPLTVHELAARLIEGMDLSMSSCAHGEVVLHVRREIVTKLRSAT